MAGYFAYPVLHILEKSAHIRGEVNDMGRLKFLKESHAGRQVAEVGVSTTSEQPLGPVTGTWATRVSSDDFFDAHADEAGATGDENLHRHFCGTKKITQI